MSCGIESADGDYEPERGVIQFERGDVVRTHISLLMMTMCVRSTSISISHHTLDFIAAL